MANTFAWILAMATLVTGVFWCVDRFKFAPARKAKAELALTQSGGTLDKETLDKIRKPTGLWETGVSLFPVLAVVFIVRSFIYEPFQIPSGSMMPTLLVGDFILVEKYSYGIKNPLTQSTLIETGHPSRGDIAVFKYPRDTQLDYIKRVIGVPGDRVSYDAPNKQLKIQPACAEGQSCDALAVTYSAGEPSEFVEMLQSLQQVPLTEETSGVRLEKLEEKLGDVTHNILTTPGSPTGFGYQQPGQQVGEFVVPEGHYFMMGDNRDNSADSRFWGFVPEKNLVGKATIIWMSFKKEEGEWPTGVRLNRIGSIH